MPKLDRRLVLLGAAGVGLYLLTRQGGVAGDGNNPAQGSRVPVPQSQTSNGRGEFWPIGKLVTTSDGRPGIVVAG